MQSIKTNTVPASWRVGPHGGFVETIGTVWVRNDGELPRFAFLAGPKHLNQQGTVHGGMLLSILDHAFGMGVVSANGNTLGSSQLATIQLNAQFIGAANSGDLIETDCTILRRTRSLVFLRGECRVGDNIVVAGDGVIKVIRSAAAGRHKDAPVS